MKALTLYSPSHLHRGVTSLTNQALMTPIKQTAI